MNWSAVGAIAEVLGAVAVVVSLVYVAAQEIANTRQARLEAARDLAVRVSEVSIAVASSREGGQLLLQGQLQVLADVGEAGVVDHQAHLAVAGKLLEALVQIGGGQVHRGRQGLDTVAPLELVETATSCAGAIPVKNVRIDIGVNNLRRIG